MVSWISWTFRCLWLSLCKKISIKYGPWSFLLRQWFQEQISQLYAGLILMTVPSVIVYLFSQRYLQAGVTAGAVKS